MDVGVRHQLCDGHPQRCYRIEAEQGKFRVADDLHGPAAFGLQTWQLNAEETEIVGKIHGFAYTETL